MNLDPRNWSPLSVAELATAFAGMPVPWWIAGGVALDLFLGHTTRPHEDIDVQILRRDQSIVQGHLQHDWRLFKTKQPDPPHLAPWPSGEFLDSPINDVWARSELHDGPWRFQLMLMEAEGAEWVYRRLPSIRGRIAEMGLLTDMGVPYLRPEIQLLYKGRHDVRPKDTQDLQRLLPRLAREKAAWLLDCLRAQYPEGHEWIGLIEDRLAEP